MLMTRTRRSQTILHQKHCCEQDGRKIRSERTVPEILGATSPGSMGRILLCTADMVMYLNGPLVSA